MLNLYGSFVVVYVNRVECHILSGIDANSYYDRVRVSSFEKAIVHTWGHEALHAFPCVKDCMEALALNYPDNAVQGKQVKAICARIALGLPVGNGKDITEGGLGIKADHTKPRTPKGSGGVSLQPLTDALQGLKDSVSQA